MGERYGSSVARSCGRRLSAKAFGASGGGLRRKGRSRRRWEDAGHFHGRHLPFRFLLLLAWFASGRWKYLARTDPWSAAPSRARHQAELVRLHMLLLLARPRQYGTVVNKHAGDGGARRRPAHTATHLGTHLGVTKLRSREPQRRSGLVLAGNASGNDSKGRGQGE